MHLSEGVLHTPILLAGAVLAVIGITIGIRRLEVENLPLAALFAAAFFVAGTIHIPVGIGSVHLILNGMAGLFLGWAVFPAFLIALLLQVLFFSFGGFAVLGVNLCLMATPALIAHYLFRSFLMPKMPLKSRLFVGIGAGIIGVGGAAALASLALVLDGGKSYSSLVGLLLISHIPVFVLDSLISVGVISLLCKMYPQALNRTAIVS
ncbi:cobalamin biosynthesis protein CbiM [Rodentibacter caecimuris]|uniref:Cobalamin biosynthesis protein CbiM n=1 Tax=Rodentibacter caecimuris TaxID=1796644 RepID=A0A9X8YYG7_9PAST|nr:MULTISPECIES: cobalt transporter CbiM [Pasteurellaceae]AOF52224.1 Substrate-specific component NikM of nickel ECF transporter [Pasteurellaceae bacterium NI1060]MCX2961996.1 cobalt transporter CbiM [Rodentibacter heylii]OOF71628.1 cobalamin biosynthesis protein CbiM [Rodentibacter heylii]OOF74882.1 cobalamin biosynthesis protein CbiM [Rodentibacter heylii]OOF77847.1 cobalamin biosynthesis protein CbiM [Rodentibacter heylii]